MGLRRFVEHAVVIGRAAARDAHGRSVVGEARHEERRRIRFVLERETIHLRALLHQPRKDPQDQLQ